MNDATSHTRDERQSSGSAAAVLLGPLAAVGIVLAPFVPLLLALLESVTLGTNRVEDSCRQIGIHDELSALYQAIFRMFR